MADIIPAGIKGKYIMKKQFRKSLNLRSKKGVRILAITALGSMVAYWSPGAVCHVYASGPVRFSTYLMMDEEGNYAADEEGAYIQLFDEKGNLLVYNDDVREFLQSHSDEEGNTKLAAKEREFFLIDGKFYHDEAGENELTDLSEVMPAIFKYGTIESGYTLEADNGTVYINPLDVNGESVYVARVSGSHEELPAFTISSDGEIGYLERGSVSDGDNEVSFVYDSNYFYDENLNQIEDMESLVPETEEDEPMFAGYYLENGDDREQFIDIDGSLVLSAEEYKDMAGDGAEAQAEYCNVITLSVEGSDDITLYADLEDGTIYKDYQRTEVFEGLDEEVLSQLSGDDGRGHFAGFYRTEDGEEDGESSFVRVIDENGNVTEEGIGDTDGNSELAARFYHIINVGGGEDGGELYYSDGKVYSDPELTSEVSDVKEITGDLPDYEEEDVKDEDEEMEGVTKRYFIGYYFDSDFGGDEEDDEPGEDVMASEYDEEEFDPYEVEIDRVRFADRDGNIVFNPEDAPEIDGDMEVYETWYSVTIWDDEDEELDEETKKKLKEKKKKDKTGDDAEEADEKDKDEEDIEKEKLEGEEDPDVVKDGEEDPDAEKKDGENSDTEKKDEQISDADKDDEGVNDKEDGQTPTDVETPTESETKTESEEEKKEESESDENKTETGETEGEDANIDQTEGGEAEEGKTEGHEAKEGEGEESQEGQPENEGTGEENQEESVDEPDSTPSEDAAPVTEPSDDQTDEEQSETTDEPGEQEEEQDNQDEDEGVKEDAKTEESQGNAEKTEDNGKS